MDLITHLARFAGQLRRRGIGVATADEVDALRALTLIDVLDSSEVRLTLRTALKIARDRWDEFDEVFEEAWWRRDDASRTRVGRGLSPAARRPLRAALQPITGDATGDDTGRTVGDQPAYSPETLLRRKPFEACSEEDLARMARLLERLDPRLATRRSRRLEPARARGFVDPRRSFRRALGTGGELLSLARRARRLDRTRLVALCDTSGSMDPHVRFLLTFVLALRRSLPRTEVFVFNTALTRLTPALSRGEGRNVPRARVSLVDALADEVPDWSGGTRIGECLTQFVARWLRQLVDRSTVVIIFSDGLDRGDPSLVGDAMRAIHARARRVIWLNPLGGDPRYEPTARAMQRALPFVDRLAPAHNLESLEEIVSELSVRR